MVRTQRYQLWQRAQPVDSWHEMPHGLHRSFTLPAHPSHHHECASPRITGYSQKLRQKRMRSVTWLQGVTVLCFSVVSVCVCVRRFFACVICFVIVMLVSWMYLLSVLFCCFILAWFQ